MLCDETGLRNLSHPDELAIELAQGVLLIFRNSEQNDCLVGFPETPWHAHGNLIFVDGRGNCVEMDCLDLIAGLADGRILVCERSKRGAVAIADRWLIHKDFNGNLPILEPGESITVWRPKLVLD